MKSLLNSYCELMEQGGKKLVTLDAAGISKFAATNKNIFTFVACYISWAKTGKNTYAFNGKLRKDLGKTPSHIPLDLLKLPYEAIMICDNNKNENGKEKMALVHKANATPVISIQIIEKYPTDEGPDITNYDLILDADDIEDVLQKAKSDVKEAELIRFIFNAIFYITNYQNDRRVIYTEYPQVQLRINKTKESKKIIRLKRHLRTLCPVDIQYYGVKFDSIKKDSEMYMVMGHWRHYRHERYSDARRNEIQWIHPFFKGNIETIDEKPTIYRVK